MGLYAFVNDDPDPAGRAARVAVAFACRVAGALTRMAAATTRPTDAPVAPTASASALAGRLDLVAAARGATRATSPEVCAMECRHRVAASGARLPGERRQLTPWLRRIGAVYSGHRRSRLGPSAGRGSGGAVAATLRRVVKQAEEAAFIDLIACERDCRNCSYAAALDCDGNCGACTHNIYCPCVNPVVARSKSALRLIELRPILLQDARGRS